MFSILSDETVHGWHVFSLVRRVISTADGTAHERCFVDSPGAVGVVALDEKGCIVLVEQYRPALDSYLMEIPAGIRDIPGEDPLSTAQRELAEETGLVANTWSHLGSVVGAAALTNSRVEIFLGTGLGDVVRTPHGPEEETMAVLRVPLDQAREWVLSGRIVDAKTSVGILMASSLSGK